MRNVLACTTESLQDLTAPDLGDTDADSQDSHSKDPGGTELCWLASVELFELLDASGIESIGFREFCALMHLVAGVQSN